MAEKKENKDSLTKKVALFFVGFSLLLTLRVGLNAGSFCLKRFQIDENLFSLYISRVHNAMELGCFIGVLIGNIYVWCCGKFMEYISIVINWLFFLVNVVLLVVFITGGRKGHLTLFYWTLVASTFIYGLNQVCVYELAGQSVVFFLAAMPLSGIFISIYHMVFLNQFGDRSKYSTDLLIVIFQIILSIGITLATGALWNVAFLDKQNNPSTQNGEQSVQQQNGKGFTLATLSPMFMSIFGLGLVYMHYPGIAPGLFVNFRFVHKIDLAIMITSAVPSLIIAILSETTEYGPNKEWTGINRLWHGFIVFVVVEILLSIVFFRILHYRGTSLSMAILNKPTTAGIFTVVFFFCHIVSIGVGLPGVQANSDSKISTLNLLLALLLMNILEFMGEGYVKEFKRFNRYDWPTEDMTDLEGFTYWLTKSASNAWFSLKSTFTTDLRADLTGTS